ncbi:hypothetical protein EOT10_31790 [Streptomyces antnestii]|uniref:Uncharacterized protein n=1 Tax=Streptomyces antnestii TaxID=2494256 RepID=A0A437P8M3_9ACTN|nr:hypothetical protein [Streptomyces sp. San01]RVU18603.1 hypothetical protein EOT10_31790 [Streptomyces sp. San01]
MGMKTKVALGAVVGIVVIGVVSANSGDNGDGGNDRKPSATADKNAGGSGDAAGSGGAVGKADSAKKADSANKGTQAQQFKAFVAKNGTPKEKDAVSHITKIQGADEQNDILDSADVYTDFTGGLMGKGAGPAKLIASAFADWKDSKNGLVSVYDADGEIITNGNF